MSNTAQPGQAPAGSIDILQFNTATFRLEGLPSPTSDASAYGAGNDPASSAPVYAFAGGTGSTFSSATCRTPAATPSP